MYLLKEHTDFKDYTGLLTRNRERKRERERERKKKKEREREKEKESLGEKESLERESLGVKERETRLLKRERVCVPS